MTHSINLDSSVIISTMTGDVHSVATQACLGKLADTDAMLYLSVVSYAEIWTGIELVQEPQLKLVMGEALSRLIGNGRIEIVADNVAIAKRAAQAQSDYKRSGGKRDFLIPDFLIGANAEFYSGRPLTTNPRHFMKYFPEVEVLTPQRALQTI